jgi:hypothetical protein
MANAPKATDGVKKTKAAPQPKPIFLGIEVLDENGQPMTFDKSRINVITATKDASELLTLLESNPNAFSKKLAVSFMK